MQDSVKWQYFNIFVVYCHLNYQYNQTCELMNHLHTGDVFLFIEYC